MDNDFNKVLELAEEFGYEGLFMFKDGDKLHFRAIGDAAEMVTLMSAKICSSDLFLALFELARANTKPTKCDNAELVQSIKSAVDGKDTNVPTTPNDIKGGNDIDVGTIDNDTDVAK